MKKLSLALACIIGMMFFASCDPDTINDLMEQKPEVAFVEAEGFIAHDTTIMIDPTAEEPEPWDFKFTATANSGSESPIAKITFTVAYQDSQSADYIVNEEIEVGDPMNDTYTATFTPEAEEDAFYVITVTVQDQAKKENLAFVTVHYANPVNGSMGTFDGTMSIAGRLTTNDVAGFGQFDYDTTFNDLPVNIKLDSMEDNQVNAEITIEGRMAVVYGTIENDTITFNQFVFNKDIEVGTVVTTTVNVDFDMTMKGVLENNTLKLSGDAIGHGEGQLVTTIKVDITGTIDGTLTKVVEE